MILLCCVSVDSASSRPPVSRPSAPRLPAHGPSAHAAALSLVPKPLRVETAAGKFLIDEKTRVIVGRNSAILGEVAGFLAGQLRQSTGYPVPVIMEGEVKGLRNAIFLVVTPSERGAEGYSLSVTPAFVRIAGSSPAGIFYGMQTLFQLLPAAFEYGSVTAGVLWEIPSVFVEDAPRFSWRGMHLDCGRHFQPKAFVKKYIDLIARYKFNTFHWHLTEDQGWRIEIKKYPRLTEIGAWRAETRGDGTPHGGFYTQDDVREIVAYARERFVTIVPEIEMPGHTMAALAAYPELSCTGGPFDVATRWGVFKDVLCAGNEQTFEFLQDVLSEVIPLFPGPFVHVGGDECPKDRWTTCPKCQSRMKEEGLANAQELQSYFIKRIEKILNARGKRLIGWDEILEGGLAANATVMSWRGVDGGIAAARSGHDVVMTPTSACYFDYYQGLTGEPEANGGYLPLENVYAYEPVPASLSGEEARHILGAQGNVWSESMPTTGMVEYMAFPRVCALGEVVWTPPGAKDFRDFSERMAGQYDRLAARGVHVRVPAPTGFEGPRTFFRDTVITPVNPVPGAALRYTTDGSEPSEASRVLEGSVAVRSSMTLKARTILKSGAKSPIATGYYSLVDPALHGVHYRVFDFLPATSGDVEKLTPTTSGIIYEIGLEGLPPTKDIMAVLFTGSIRAEKEGVYMFTLGADGQTQMTIGGVPVVVDTAVGGWKQSTGRIHLREGAHPFSLSYKKVSHGRGFDLRIEGPGLERQRIPAAMLRRK